MTVKVLSWKKALRQFQKAADQATDAARRLYEMKCPTHGLVLAHKRMCTRTNRPIMGCTRKACSFEVRQ